MDYIKFPAHIPKSDRCFLAHLSQKRTLSIFDQSTSSIICYVLTFSVNDIPYEQSDRIHSVWFFDKISLECIRIYAAEVTRRHFLDKKQKKVLAG